jgi:hypothetical protein
MLDLTYTDKLLEHTAEEIAREFDVSERTARRWRQRAREKIVVPRADTVNYGPVPEISSEGAVLYFDIHAPLHNEELLTWALRFQTKWKVGTAIIPGDFMDMRSFSPFIPDPGVTFEHDLNVASGIIKVIASVSQNVLILNGNHESWFDHFAKREITPDMMLRLLDAPANVFANSHHSCILNDPLSSLPWMIGHPDQFRQSKGSVPTAIANKYWCNVVTGHEHTFYTSESIGGQAVVAAVGCIADINKLGYAVKKLNSTPMMSEGFGVIKNGRLHNLSWRHSDFGAELRKYY